jgi:amino acid transporter
MLSSIYNFFGLDQSSDMSGRNISYQNYKPAATSEASAQNVEMSMIPNNSTTNTSSNPAHRPRSDSGGRFRLRPRSRSGTLTSSASHVSTGKDTLGVLSLCFLTYYSVSGGPFGFEDIVRAGGPFYALMGFSLMLVWAIPEALVTIEMSVAMPEPAGSVAWVEAAFGSMWAFQQGWLSSLSGIADNALYPILFLDCLMQIMTDENGVNPLTNREGLRYIITFSIIAILTYLNYRGLDLVGKLTISVGIFTLLPFVVFVIMGSFEVQPHRWFEGPEDGVFGVDWRLMLNTFYWNINFWDSAATFSGEVENPADKYPKAVAGALIIVFLSNFLPILIGTGASNKPWTQWKDGHFVSVAAEVVGPWLGYWMIVASGMTQIGMFEAEMSSDAWQVAGMAERGIIPKVFAVRSKYDSPVYGIALSLGGVLLCTMMKFTEVVDLLNLLFCFSQAIEFIAFIELRKTYPHMQRPWKIPLGTTGVIIMLSIPLFATLLIIYFSSLKSLIISGCLTCLGFPVYFLIEKARAANWCDFYPYEPYCHFDPVHRSPSTDYDEEIFEYDVKGVDLGDELSRQQEEEGESRM